MDTQKTNVGAILWILCLQYFVAEAVSVWGWPGHYSFSENYISDLGAVHCGARALGLNGQTETLCSPLHAVMNASFLLQGLLIACGTSLVWRLFPRGKLWVVALLLVGVSGLGVFVVGLAPEDVMPALHRLGATENFLCCNAGMAVMGIAMLRSRQGSRRLGAVTLICGIIGLAGIGCLGMQTYLGLGVGGMERVTAYPFPLWISGMGALLLRRGGLRRGALAAVSP
jgi:hypothetical membrane protein